MSNREDPKVIIAAKELAIHTLKVTSNTNNFPKKYRLTIVNEISNLALGIYTDIVDANCATGAGRVNYQNAAISKCRKLRGCLEISLEVIHPSCSILYWSKMIDQIESQLLNWRKYTLKK